MKETAETKKHKSTLKEHMSSANRHALGNSPTTHKNCVDKCGVARPGKTARDRRKEAGKADIARMARSAARKSN